MQLKSSCLFLLAAASTFSITQGLVDCDVEVSRSGNSPLPLVCTHFDGNQVEAYHSWYNRKAIDTKYPSMVFLQGADPNAPQNGAAVHWKVDNSHVYVAVAVRATGWLSFGIAEAGGMIGADMLLFESSKPDQIVDAYTTDVRFPQPDECAPDWELIDSTIDDEAGFMMIEVKRLLDTGDDQDKAIFDDASSLIPPHRVIAAWGDSDEVSYHGLNRARGAIRFFGTGDEQSTFEKIIAQSAEGSFFVGAENHEIDSRSDTEYAYYCVDRDGLIEQGVLDTTSLLNVIGFEPIIDAGNEAFVHHYIIYGSTQSSCADTTDFEELAYVWAPGEGPLVLPEHLGAPLFGEDGFQAFEIEIHYNNPTRTPGVIDNSGVQVFWTSNVREEQIGVMSVGDPNVSLGGTDVGNGVAEHSFECPGTCSSLVGEPVTVLREYLHMHETGARVVNEQIRGDEVIRRASVEYWEFDQNGNAAVQQDPFVVEPGDGFRTTCYFNGNSRKFGLASSEEMCMAFLYYYPRIKIRVEEIDAEFPWTCGYDIGFPLCETTWESRILSEPQDMNREFGQAHEAGCSATDVEVPGESEAPNGSPSANDSDGAYSSNLLFPTMALASALVGLASF